MPENTPDPSQSPPGTTGDETPRAVPEASPGCHGRYSLEMRLFGPAEIRVGHQPLSHLRSRKGLWLLTLLALRKNRNVDRDWIAGTFWPDCDEAHARCNLRQSLHDLRQALGSEAWRLTSDEPRTLRLDLGGVYVDALEFDVAIDRGDHSSLAEAVQLYRGPLLEDCSEEWALEGRRYREQAVMEALEALASDAARRQENGLAVERLRRALQIDPYREDLQRALMNALASDGSPAAAMVAYRDYRALLGRELMGEPAEETASLFRRLKQEARVRAKPSVDSQRRPARPQSRASTAPPRSLPIPLTALIGREEEVRHVVSLAARARLITLTGTGGVGKTRLAIRVAEELDSDYRDGVVFVDLAPLENPDLLFDVVRAAVAAPEDKGRKDPAEALCSYLATRRTLLILDNCERITGACRSLAELLLGRCADLRILATSREVLGIKGETVWRVPSLEVPKTNSYKPILVEDIRPVSTFEDFAAIRLFAERACAVEAAFELSHKNSIAVVKICSRLDGIPLAIELAAARVKGMPVEKIAERLNDRFRILLGRRQPHAGAPIPRHQTLRASIDWSYDLLPEPERTLLMRLAVFSGGWTLEAAEAVCSGGPVREWELVEKLTDLVDKSLVVYQPDEDRYRLLEMIRQYLTERLNEEGTEPGLRTTHLAYFVELCEASETELVSAGQAAWMDRLEADHDNLRAALTWASSPEGDVEFGLRLAGAVWRFWDMRGYSREGRIWLSTLLQASFAGPPTAARAKALFGAAQLAFRYGDIDASRALQEECLTIQTHLGDREGAARALNGLGNAASVQGDFTQAASAYERGLAISRELGDRRLVAIALNNLGNLAIDQGDLANARRLQEENLQIRRELDDQRGIAIALNNLALVAKNEGDYPTAKRLHMEGLSHDEILGDQRGIAVTLSNLGNTALLMGDSEEAEALLSRSLNILWQLGDKSSVAATLEALASARSAMRSSVEAAMLWGAAERLREELGTPPVPGEVARYMECVSTARVAVGAAKFDAAWQRGRTMDLASAVAIGVGESRTCWGDQKVHF